MGELSIEEKAKAYDEAIERARKINSGEGVAASPDWTTCEVIFPELKESEDERIRKALLNAFQESEDSLHMVLTPHRRESFIAWLEKQGSQNIANSAKTCKVEQNPAWSEEDIKTIERIVCILDGIRYYNTVDNKQEKPYQSEIDFLKSLKERYTWKPSDEQIE